MDRTRGGHSYKPRVQPSSPPLVGVTPLTAGPSTAEPAVVPAAGLSILIAAATIKAPTPVSAAPASLSYDTQVKPTPPSSPHQRPSLRAPPPKRAKTSGLGESSSLQAQEPQSPPVQEPTADFPLDLSLASIIRRPIFHRGPIAGNSDCSAKELHDETFYDILAASALLEFRDSMRLVQRYSLEPFMTPH